MFTDPPFSTLSLQLEAVPMNHNQNTHRETESSESFSRLPSRQPQIELDISKPSSITSGDPEMVKKLSHNASERDRRKRLNDLFFSLRSLLPRTDRSKKLSIPSTVSYALKYIPELQKQVQKLMQRKEEILEIMCKERQPILPYKQSKGTKVPSFFPVVTVSQVDDKDYVIQISTMKAKSIPLYVILQDFEKDGLQVLNASAFNSCGKMVCYNLHLQSQKWLRNAFDKSGPIFVVRELTRCLEIVLDLKSAKETPVVKCEMLSQQLMSLYQNQGELQSEGLNVDNVRGGLQIQL